MRLLILVLALMLLVACPVKYRFRRRLVCKGVVKVD